MLSKLDDLTIALTRLHAMGFTDDAFLNILDTFDGPLRISLCRILQKEEIDFKSVQLRRMCFFLLKASKGDLAAEVKIITRRIAEKEQEKLIMDLLVDSEPLQSFALNMMVSYKIKDFSVEIFKLWSKSSDRLKKEVIKTFRELHLRGAEVFLEQKLKTNESIQIESEILRFFLNPHLKNRKKVFSSFLNSPEENLRILALRGIISYGSTREKRKLKMRLSFEKSPQVLRVLLDFICQYFGKNILEFLITKYQKEEDPSVKNLLQYAFRNIGENNVCEYCLKVLAEDEDSSQRIFAMQELSCIQKPEVNSTLIRIMNDSSEEGLIRSTAIESLCFQPVPESVQALEKFIISTDDEILSYTASHSLSFLWTVKDLSSCERILNLNEKRYSLEMSAALDFIRKRVEARKLVTLPKSILTTILKLAGSENKSLSYPALKALCHVDNLPINRILHLFEREGNEENIEVLYECLGACTEEHRESFVLWLENAEPHMKLHSIKMMSFLEGSETFKAEMFLEVLKICEQHPSFIKESEETV
ncbi:MAG: HEAT repeat domain-containing protein, partial [Lentisphaeraceae bacterium]|nr:HEAT repeat domain-containing protein [Lentisphaeraceae bacterium]